MSSLKKKKERNGKKMAAAGGGEPDVPRAHGDGDGGAFRLRQEPQHHLAPGLPPRPLRPAADHVRAGPQRRVLGALLRHLPRPTAAAAARRAPTQRLALPAFARLRHFRPRPQSLRPGQQRRLWK